MIRCHSFRLVVVLLAASFAATAGATEVCRTPETASAELGEILVRVNRAIPATFVFSDPHFAGTTFSLHGHVCDRAGHPLPDFKLRVARYEGELPVSRPPSVEDFEKLELIDSREVTTARDGSLSVPVLGPGTYVLLPDWDDLAPERADLPGVIYDLRKTYSATLLSQL